MSALMKRVLENAGYYMAPVDGDGADGGKGAAGSSQEGADEGDKAGEGDTDKGAGQKGGDEGDGDDDDDAGAAKTGMSEADAKLLRDVMKWKERARGAEDEMGKLKATVGELSKIKEAVGDVEPEQLQALIQQQRDQERQQLEAKGEYDRILEQVKGEHTKTVTELKDERDQLATQLAKTAAHIEELTVGREFSDSTYIRERSLLPPKISRKEFGAHFEFVDGELVGYDKPHGASDRTPLVDGEGKPKKFDAAIEQLYSEHPDAPSLIRSVQKPGAGSNSTDKGGKSNGKGSGAEQLRGRDRITAALSRS